MANDSTTTGLPVDGHTAKRVIEAVFGAAFKGRAATHELQEAIAQAFGLPTRQQMAETVDRLDRIEGLVKKLQRELEAERAKNTAPAKKKKAT